MLCASITSVDGVIILKRRSEYGKAKETQILNLTEVREKGRELMATDDKAGRLFLCQNDLKYLCVEYLGYRDWDVIHDKMANFLRDSTKKFKLMLLPRGHLKSSVVTIGWVMQRILNDPNIRILISNVKWGNAKNFLHQIKQFMLDFSDLKDIFGCFKSEDRFSGGWNRENVTVAQRTRTHPEPTIQTCGIESEQTSQHYQTIVHDDIVARDNIGTMEQIEKVKNYYKDSLSLLEPNGDVVCIGTTWADSDLYSELQLDEDYDILKIPAYTQTFDKRGRCHRKILFPKKFSYEILMKLKKRLGPYQFSSQYMLDPYPDEAQEFKKSWIQHYDRIPEIDGKPQKLYIITVLDPSLGKKTSNHAGLTTTGITKDGTVYILEARRFKRMVDYIPEEVVKTVKKFNSNVFGLERFAFQQLLEGPIRRAMEAEGIKCVVELLPYMTADKNTRIQSLIPMFSSGKIWMKEDMTDLIDELMKFSPTRKNNQDDIIDSLAWHNVYWSRKPTGDREYSEKEGTFNWWMGRMKPQVKNDIFWDFRKSNNDQPVYVR